MSTRVAVVCEDPIYDQYIAKPIVEAAMKKIGKPNAVVRVVCDPKTSGWESLIANVPAALARWGATASAVVFLGDADGNDGTDGKPNRLLQLQQAIEGAASPHCGVAVIAIQELEVWALWASAAELGVGWDVVRAHRDPKERFLESLVSPAGAQLPDKGRKALIEASLGKGWQSLTQACTELQSLEEGLRECLST